MNADYDYTIYFVWCSCGDPHGMYRDFSIVPKGTQWSQHVRGDGHSYNGKWRENEYVKGSWQKARDLVDKIMAEEGIQ